MKKAQMASKKNHISGPRKRVEEDNESFCREFEKLIKKFLHKSLVSD